jgi:hypothetical protein
LVLTSKVTGIEIIELAAEGAVMLMVPSQVPAASPVVLICTLKVAGAAPL